MGTSDRTIDLPEPTEEMVFQPLRAVIEISPADDPELYTMHMLAQVMAFTQNSATPLTAAGEARVAKWFYDRYSEEEQS